MQKIINQLTQQPSCTKPQFDNALNTWFLLDKVRNEKTLSSFYQGNLKLIAEIDYLLARTEHAYLLEESPLLIKLNHTQLPESTYKHIQHERSGIFFQSKDSTILKQLQYLFIMQSETDGKIYSRYYDPIFWTALQLGLPDKQQLLWGNIDKAFNLTHRSTPEKLDYFTWEKVCEKNNLSLSLNQMSIGLTKDFFLISEKVRLVYVLFQLINAEKIAIQIDQINYTINNLYTLTQFGIDRMDYLQRLLKPCIEQIDFTKKLEVQHILQKDLLAYKKVTALEELIKIGNNHG